MMTETEFTVAGYRIRIFPSEDSSQVFYWNGMEDAIQDPRAYLLKPFPTVVAITVSDWEKDFSPFPHAKVFPHGRDFSGGADAYLSVLVTKILPEAERRLPRPVSNRVLIGYSLAGLFAFYALFRTDVFSEIGAVSGSLWYPGFVNFMKATPLKGRPKKVYLSLGDKESKIRNLYLSQAASAMETASLYLTKENIPFRYETNPGGHFVDVEKRMAAAFRFLIE